MVTKKDTLEISEAKQTLEEFIEKDAEVSLAIEEESATSEVEFRALLNKFQVQKINQRNIDENESPNINIFDITRIGHREVLHSRILRWLFDPEESHEQGDLFLRIFADKFGIQVGDAVEYKANAEDSDEESRIDITIVKKNMFFICIENKIFASEGEEQTLREYDTSTRKAAAHGISIENIKCFFLTINGDEAKDKEHFRPITWRDILGLIEEYASKAKSKKVVWFVSQYIDSVKKTIKESEYDRQIQSPGNVDSEEL